MKVCRRNKPVSLVLMALLPMAVVGCSTMPMGMGQGDAWVKENLGIADVSRTYRASSANEDLAANGDSRSIEPGETLVVADLEGPGMITHIWSTVASADPFYPRSLVVRMYWDGADQPSVEAPLGDFFAVGNAAYADVNSAAVSASSFGRARNCYWRMPFRKRALVTVTNESQRYRTDSFYYYVDWVKCGSLPSKTPYFHAQYRQQTPAQPGDYRILETEGRGWYVGTVYSVQQVELGWFGEGDDRFYVDGEEYPSLSGTGTEDYFCDAWGFRQFSTPYYGVPVFEGYFPGDRVTAYRWHLKDPVVFGKSLTVDIEHKGSVFTDTAQHLGQHLERPDWASSVAFWYQYPMVQFSGFMPPVEERVAPYQVLPANTLTCRASPESALNAENPGVTFTPLMPDGTIEFDFDVSQPGRYQINAILQHSLLAGMYSVHLDGELLDEALDLCIVGHDSLWVSFDLHDLRAGTHTLRFEGQGPSPNMRTQAPPLFAFGLEYLILLRLEDLTGYRQVMEGLISEAQTPPAAAEEAEAEPPVEETLLVPLESESDVETPSGGQEGGPWAVQVVALTVDNQDKADQLKQVLSADYSMVNLESSEDGRFIRVLVAGFPDEAAARAACAELQTRKGLHDAFVRKTE